MLYGFWLVCQGTIQSFLQPTHIFWPALSAESLKNYIQVLKTPYKQTSHPGIWSVANSFIRKLRFLMDLNNTFLYHRYSFLNSKIIFFFHSFLVAKWNGTTECGWTGIHHINTLWWHEESYNAWTKVHTIARFKCF